MRIVCTYFGHLSGLVTLAGQVYPYEHLICSSETSGGENTARVSNPRVGPPQRGESSTNSQQISATCWMTLGWASRAKRSRLSSTSSTKLMGRLPSVRCPGVPRVLATVAVAMILLLQASSSTHGLGWPCAVLIAGCFSSCKSGGLGEVSERKKQIVWAARWLQPNPQHDVHLFRDKDDWLMKPRRICRCVTSEHDTCPLLSNACLG